MSRSVLLNSEGIVPTLRADRHNAAQEPVTHDRRPLNWLNHCALTFFSEPINGERPIFLVFAATAVPGAEKYCLENNTYSRKGGKYGLLVLSVFSAML
jgi:hypothetical protein